MCEECKKDRKKVPPKKDDKDKDSKDEKQSMAGMMPDVGDASVV